MRAAAQAQADEARRLADQRAAEAAQAQLAADQAAREREALREQLREQLNVILETRETARGLIINLSDVLFDVDKATLKPGAREKLARIAGILATHPDLRIEIEGHTDSTGSDEYNQRLSERRADSVRGYLSEQGISRADRGDRGLRQDAPGRDERHGGRTAAEPPRRDHRVGRVDRTNALESVLYFDVAWSAAQSSYRGVRLCRTYT